MITASVMKGLKVENQELKFKNWNASSEFKSPSYKYKSTSCKLKCMIYKFKSTSYKYKFTSYEFKSISCKFKSTSSRTIKSMKTQVNNLTNQFRLDWPLGLIWAYLWKYVKYELMFYLLFSIKNYFEISRLVLKNFSFISCQHKK